MKIRSNIYCGIERAASEGKRWASEYLRKRVEGWLQNAIGPIFVAA